MNSAIARVFACFLYFSVLLDSGALAQEFVEKSHGLIVVAESSVAWGDYDGDGDLDILLTGLESGGQSKVYRNNGNETFTDLLAALDGVWSSSVAWGDYDGDGDLDILLTGWHVTNPGTLFENFISISRIYRNNGNETFTDILAALEGVWLSSVAWGDYDGDGDLDILLTGETYGFGQVNAKVYRNDAGVFTDISAGLEGVRDSSVAWGDYDGDGDLDILLTGQNSSLVRISKIYRNDAGIFTDIAAGLEGVYSSSVAWGDYNGDGDLDILLTGISSSGRISKIYRNDAGVFTSIDAALQGVGNSSVAWGDYDGDGDLDILLTGQSASGYISKVYRNDGGVFSDAIAGLEGVGWSSAAWGDYDGDFDLDILLTGRKSIGLISRIFTNNSVENGTSYTAPSVPTNLISTIDAAQKQVSLTWDAANDNTTNTNSLSYNVYIRDQGVTDYIASPQALESDGWRLVPTMGNGQLGTNYLWNFSNEDLGKTFEWKVQAIDNSFNGGAFSELNSFVLAIEADAPTALSANPGVSSGHISFTEPESNGGLPIINYKYSIDDGETWRAFDPAAKSGAVTIEDLTNCVPYSVKIRAVTAFGDGAASEAVLVTPKDGQREGITWESQTAAAANFWTSVTYGNGRFVAVSLDGTNRVMTSPDGITWGASSVPENNEWTSVTYGNGRFVAVSFDGTNRVMTSENGTTWEARSATENNEWVSVTYGNGLFVAVAGSGTNRVMTSPDGITWTARVASENNAWTSVTYGNGLFVAVSLDGTNRVMTSPDGTTWTASPATEDNRWISVTYGNDLFVAVSVDGTGTNRVMTSPDGLTWTTQNASEANFWASVTYGNGLFVAVSTNGSNNLVMTSLDGATWTAQTPAETNQWSSVTYGNGLFVAVSIDGNVMTSSALFAPEPPTIDNITPGITSLSVAFSPPADAGGSAISNYEYSIDDGANWVTVDPAQITSPILIEGLAPSTTYQVKLKALNDQGVSCESEMVEATTSTPLPADAPTSLTANPGVSSGHISFTEPASNGGSPIINYEYELDGSGTWIPFDPAAKSGAVTIEGLTNCVTYSVKIRAVTAFEDGVASESVLVTPIDGEREGITWTSRMAEQNSWSSITYGKGLFVAVSPADGPNQVMTSPDGITWTARDAAENNVWNSVTYGNGLFVAVSTSGANRVMTSPDGITWVARSVPVNNIWFSVTYGNGLFVAVSIDGANRVMTSPDGINWTERAALEQNIWLSVTYGNGLFVAVSSDGTNQVMTSSDGVNWTARAAENNYWTSVTYGNGLFVAVSFSDQVMTSSDGITWVARSVPVANTWYSVTYGNGLFVAVSFSDQVMTSPDGITWSGRVAPENNQWRSITYGNGRFVSVSQNGTNRVMTSSALFAPDPPTIDNITPGVTSLSVAFSPPASVGGSAISNYEYSIDDGVNWITLDPAQITSPILIEGLTPSTANQVKLKVLNDQGVSCESEMVEATTSTPLPADAPTSLTANPGVSSGHISFTEPASNGGSPIINYEYELDGSGTWIPFDPAAKSGAVTIEGLTNCVTYSVKIRAVTAFEDGVASEAVEVTPLDGQQEGITWEYQTATEEKLWQSMTYGNGLFVALCTSCTKQIMTSPDGITWTARDSPARKSWRSVTYGNGLFVAVDWDGGWDGPNKVMTSPDGITWALRDGVEQNRWTSVTYGNGLFVAVATNGTNQVMTSPDGINWTARTAAKFSNWLSVTYGKGLFVAIASGNNVMTSPDGIAWTAQTAAADNQWQSVTYGNGIFVAVSFRGDNPVMTSPDGITWTAQTGTEASDTRSVTYGNGLFVAVSEEGINRVATSPDGITWTSQSFSDENWWQSVAYGNGVFVASSFQGKIIRSSALFAPEPPTIDLITPSINSLSVVFSPPASVGGSAINNYEYSIDDGVNWITLDPAQITSPILIEGLAPSTTYQVKLKALNDQGVSCESEMVEATTTTPLPADAPTSLSANPGVSSGHISFTEPASNGGSPIINYEYELDGSGTWIPFDPAAKSGAVTIEGLTNCVEYLVRLRAVTAFGPGAASEAILVTPKDGQQEGITWESQIAAENNQWISVTYGNGQFVAVSASGTNRVMTSPDGITWESQTAASNYSWRSVTYGNGLFVAVSGTGTNRVMTSPDGITWTARVASENNAWTSVTYGNGLFVAVSFDGTEGMTSLDGITWTPTNGYGIPSPGLASTFGNGLFVSPNTNGVMTSSDGVNWTFRNAIAGSTWTSITYGNGLYVAVATSGSNRLMTSIDGLTWTIPTVPLIGAWTSVVYGNGLFVAVSLEGTLMTSSDGISWTVLSIPASNQWSSITYGNGTFVAVSFEGKVISSSALFAPEPPTIDLITPSINSLSVAFSPPASVGGSAINNYEYSIDDGANWVTLDPAQITSPILIEGLTPSTSYPIKLRAVNGQGLSCESNRVEATTTGPIQLEIIVSPDQSKVFGEADPVFTYTVTGFQDGDTEDLITGVLVREPGEDVGVYAINQGSLSVDPKYTINFTSADFEITSVDPIQLEIIVTPGQSKVFGEADPVFTYTVTGFQDGDTEDLITGVLVREPGEDVGVYAINQGSLSVDPKYTINFTSADFEITPATIEEITLEDGTFTFDGTSKSLEITGTLPEGTTVSYTNNERTDVGSQEVTATITGDGFTTVVLTATLTITPATIEGVTFEDGTFTFDGTAKSLEITGTLPEGTTVSYTNNERTEVGSQEVTATISGDNYTTLELTATLTITEQPLDVTFDDGSFTFDGTSKSLEITGTLPEGTTVTYTNNERTDVGSQEVTATITGDGFTTVVLTATLTITPATIEGITFEDGTFTFDGTVKSLEITGTLPEGTTVSYTNNERTEVGSQEVTATISGDNYTTLELTATLTIEAAPEEITLEDGIFTFDGTSKSLEITGTLPEGTTVSYTNNERTDVGSQEVTATITGDGFTTVVLTATLTITPATVEGVTFEDGTFTFDGTAKSLEITGTLPEGTTISYTNNERTEVGSQEVTATISGDNYTTLELTATLTIEAAPEEITLEDGTFTFDGTSKSLEITGTLPEGTTVSYTNNERTDVGSQEVTATITGDGFTTVVLTATLTITPATIEGITFEDEIFTFDGTAKSLEITGTLPEGTTVSYTNNERTEVGSQEVTATISGDNYTTLELTATLTITEQPLDVTFEDGSFTFDGTSKSLEITGTLPEGTTVTYTNNERTDVGSQEVTATITGDGFTTVVLTATLTITPATIEGVTFEDGTFTFDGTAKSLEITGTLPEGTTVSYTNNERTEVGSQEVTATISGDNYTTLELTATLTIEAAPEEITLEDGTFTFDGTSKSLEITGTLPEGTIVTYTNNERTDVGSQEVTATITGDGFTTVVLTATLTITPATIEGITFEDGIFTFDGTAKSLEITGTLPEGTTVSYTNNERTEVGSQEVTATISGDNYTTLELTATLTITEQPLDVTFENGSFTFDGASKSLEITGTLPEGTTVSYTNNERTDVGSQEVTATITGDGFTTVVLTATLTITPATIEGITFEDGTFTFDGTVKSLEITGTLPEGTTVSYTNNERTEVGSQEVTATISGDNYTTLELTATLTIEAAPEEITLEDGTFTFDGTPKSLEITGTLPEGTTVSYTNNERTDVGSQEVTATITGDGFTTVVFTATLTITPATIEGITFEDGIFTFDGTTKSLEITGTLPEGTTVSYTNNERTEVGSQEVTATISGDNYTTLELTATLAITAEPLDVTFEDGSFIYDGTVKSLGLTGTLPEGVTVSYSNNERRDVGSQEVTATISGDDFVTLELTSQLIITPAELIVIVDEGQSKLLGEPNDPELTFTVTGLGEGDEESVLTGTLVRETGEDIGLYAISQGSLDAGINYTISFTGADFEIVNDDTDGDGVPDAVEIDQGTDPANKDDYRDTDGDDVPDYVEEFVENTDENNPKDYLDRDGDLVPDYVEEVREDTDPTDSADYRDTDGDGVPDYVQDRSIVEFVEESITVAWGTLEGDLVLATEVVGITGRGEFLNLAVIWDLSGYDPQAVGTNSFQGAATLPIRLFDTYPINPVLSITIEPKPAPEDVTLSNSEFVAIPNEFLQEIGFFTVVDPLDDVHEIILIAGAADNEYFEIIDGVLFWNSTDQAQGRSQFTIQVSVTDRAGNVLEKSFEITRTRTPLDELDVPNTFTPNNDGVNDTWGIPELGFYGGVKIEIFQIEGGERIFVTEDPEIGWDGSINGKEPVVSAYVWVISIEETGEVLKGMLNLLNR